MLDHQDVLPAIKLCGRKITRAAVEDASEDSLNRCEQEGFEFDEKAWAWAARVDSVTAVKWLRKQQIPCDTDEFFNVAWDNKLDGVLQGCRESVSSSTIAPSPSTCISLP